MPGPLSATRINKVPSSWLTVTSTHGSSRSQASIALSIRLPSTVTISWPDSARSSAFDGRCVSSVTVSSMPRSSAWAVLPSSSATSAGSPTALDSRSTSCCDSSSSLVANLTASSARPISTIVTMVCSLLAASCACDRNVSVSTFSELSSPSAPCNSVRSRMVTTSASRGPSSTWERLTTSTRSSVTCTSSRAPGLYVRRNSGRSDRSTGPGGSASSLRASSLASATPLRSNTISPSDTECRIASWCSYITRSSSGRSPCVCRNSRRRIAHTPTNATASAARLTAAIVGTCERQRSARLCCRMPADTSPTMRPDSLRTGATARIDGPSVPV